VKIATPSKKANVCQYQGLVLKTRSMKIIPDVSIAQANINTSAIRGIFKVMHVRI
jgi:hypothetical protein